jgi:hypothetical protein
VEETGPSHPGGVCNGAKGSSSNVDAGSGAGRTAHESERLGRRRHVRPDTRNRLDVQR